MRARQDKQPATQVRRGASWWVDAGRGDKWKDEAAAAAERMAAEDSRKVSRGMTIGWAVSGRKS